MLDAIGHTSKLFDDKWVIVVTDPFIIKGRMNNAYIQNHDVVIPAYLECDIVVFRFHKYNHIAAKRKEILQSFFDISDDIKFNQSRLTYDLFDPMLSVYLKLKYGLTDLSTYSMP